MVMRSWYMRQALGLGMRQGLDLDLLQLAHHCEEQDRNFI